MSQKYVALLRGINVGGKRKLKMADLRESVLKIGFKEVSTYIQSGNLFFTAEEKNTAILEEKLAQHLLEEYTYDIPVIIRTAEEIEKVIAQNPFPEAEDFKQLHQGVLGKVEEYDKRMQEVGTELHAVGKVFKDVVPVFTENVKELRSITKGMKENSGPNQS